jgi:hypothetical protein
MGDTYYTKFLFAARTRLSPVLRPTSFNTRCAPPCTISRVGAKDCRSQSLHTQVMRSARRAVVVFYVRAVLPADRARFLRQHRTALTLLLPGVGVVNGFAVQPRRGIRSQVIPLENGSPDKAALITSCHARSRSRIRYASVTQPWLFVSGGRAERHSQFIWSVAFLNQEASADWPGRPNNGGPPTGKDSLLGHISMALSNDGSCGSRSIGSYQGQRSAAPASTERAYGSTYSSMGREGAV